MAHASETAGPCEQAAASLTDLFGEIGTVHKNDFAQLQERLNETHARKVFQLERFEGGAP